MSRKKVILGAVADDFTGATDLAALMARSGLSVSLRIGTPALETTSDADCEVVALKIRTEPVEEAVDEALKALSWLQAVGAGTFFWKYCSTFDSTGKGNIGPVAEAIMRKLGCSQTVYCPSFPENGRTVFQGHMFVGEELLSDSPMRAHPLTPMTDSSLPRLLSPQVSGSVGLINQNVVSSGVAAVQSRLALLGADGVSHVILDAINDDDLSVLGPALAPMKFVTGGSAIALPLVQALSNSDRTDHGTSETLEIANAPLVLSGSCSATTQKQVAHFAQNHPAFKLNPLELASEAGALEKAKNWLKAQTVGAPKMIYATAEPDAVKKAQAVLGRDRAGQLVEDALAELAQFALQIGHRQFVVAGGESSGAVTKALSVKQLKIGKEIAPGVPWTYTMSGSIPVALALKSGNFGNEKFFQIALDGL